MKGRVNRGRIWSFSRKEKSNSCNDGAERLMEGREGAATYEMEEKERATGVGWTWRGTEDEVLEKKKKMRKGWGVMGQTGNRKGGKSARRVIEN